MNHYRFPLVSDRQITYQTTHQTTSGPTSQPMSTPGNTVKESIVNGVSPLCGQAPGSLCYACVREQFIKAQQQGISTDCSVAMGICEGMDACMGN